MADDSFDAFVSYARADSRHAADIVSVLQARGLTLFFDRHNLPPGLPWVRGLEKALNAAKAAIVLIGPHGLGNTQQYERDLALYRQTRDPSFPIVPVILPEAQIDRPFNFLQILTWIDFSRVVKVSDAPAELDDLVAAVRGEQISAANAAREAICPYRGLDAFREEDSVFFFGRGTADDPESAIGQLVRKVREHPFVMVVGRSGSGKSSLVYAGLLPALRRDRDRFWNVLPLRPGRAPMRALAAAFNPRADDEGAAEYAKRITKEADELRTGDPELLSHMIREQLDQAEGKPDQLLLYVDQWEELYAQAPSTSDKERAVQHRADVNRFISLLLTAARTAPVAVVATMRADFYDPLIGHEEIKSLLPTRQVLLGKMLRSELESTIVEPARKVGLTFDPPTLVLRILDESGEDEGMLPLLQYALKESWALRKGNAITGDSYARSGGVREAIRITAERTFDALSAADQQAARQLFLRLVTPGEGQEDTRARAAMPSEPMQRRIVEQFAGPRTRLLVTGYDRASRPTVEVAHEALIRTWPRLREWIDSNREKLRARAALLQAKVDWEQNHRRDDMLLPTGLQLERARNLLADPGDISTDEIKEFISLSSAREETERKQREAADRQRKRRRAVAAGAVAILIPVLISLAYIYRLQGLQVSFKAQRDRAETDRIITSGLPPELTRVSNLQAATQAVRNGLVGYGRVWASLQQVSEVSRFNAGDTIQGQVHAADFAPDSKSILAIDYGGVLHQWALTSGNKAIRELSIGPPDANGTPAQGRSIRVSPQGDVAAVGFGDGSVVLVDLTSTPRTRALQINGDKPHRSPGPDRVASVFKLVFSFDGSLLVTTSRSGNIAIWQRSPSKAEAENGPPADPLNWTLLRNVDLNAPQQPAEIWSVDVDRAKQNIAAGLFDGRVCLLRVNGPDRPLCSADGHAEGKTVKSVAFWPGKPRLVSAGNDAKVTIWNVDTATSQLVPWPIALYQDNAIWDVDFSRDGSLLATASWDGSVRIYQTNTWRLLNTIGADRVGRIRSEGGSIGGRSGNTSFALRTVRFDSTSSMLVTSSLDHTARVWAPLWDRTSLLDLSYRLPPLGNFRNIASVALAPGGQVAFTDGTAVFLHGPGEEPKRLPVPADEQIKGVADRETEQPLRFSQVLMPSEKEVLASSVEARLVFWTQAAGGEWEAQTIGLRGDAVSAGRGIAVDRMGVTLAVEVREGEQASILLCRRADDHRHWNCPMAGDSVAARIPLPTSFKACIDKKTQVVFTFSKSARLLAVGAGHCSIEVLDTRNTRAPPRLLGVDNSDFNLTALDFSPDEKALVGTSSNGNDPEVPVVRVWDLASGSSRNINHHTSPFITAAKYSPSGRWIISTALDNTVIVSSADTGEKLVSLRYRNSLVALDVAATSRGTLIATGSEAGDVNVARFFEDADEITSYATSVLQEISD
jgi:WD40 repeat protein